MISLGRFGTRRRLCGTSAFAGVIFAAGLISGCGVGTVDTSTSGPLAMRGNLMGGQQGVAGASVQLYSAGKTGNGSAATSLLTSAVTTDKFGFFSITGLYSCPSSSDQVYLVGTGGDPGLGANNSAIAMMAALGDCGTLLSQGASRFVFVNEITTAAAAWTLAPFMTGLANVGASATNAAGLRNAFLDAALLADTTAGNVATNGNGLLIESGKLTALANSLASCINSAGGSGCTPLFTAATPPGGTTPTNTVAAALNIVKNPASNVAAVFNAATATPPFATTLTSAPHDWTMSLTVPLAAATGANPYAAPTALDIDAQGTVWVAGLYGIVNAVTPQGSLLSSTGFGAGSVNESFGLTIDTSGYVWVANEQSANRNAGSVSKLQGSAMASPGAVVSGNGGTNFYDNSINFPYDVAADASGHVFIANYASGAVTEYATSTNAPVATALGSGYGAYTVSAFPDAYGGVWLANNSGSNVTHVLANGTASNITCCSSANGLATDAAGNVWVANYANSSVSAVSNAGAVLVNQATGGGLTNPARLSVDAGGTVWVANYHGSSFSALSSGTVTGNPAQGTMLSPSGGFGLDAGLLEPYAIVADRSGNLWVSNFYKNDLVVFFGLATPTSTPTMPTPAAP